jgi:Protein of unknown function (DUF3300)
MQQKPRLTAILLCVVLLLLHEFEPRLAAQATAYTPQELDQLLSPIALYPDSLLSQIMTASTSPQQILDVDNWLNANPGLQGTALTDAAQQQGFDPAFIALVSFPQVLNMMAQNIDDYAAIGQAFLADQASVSDSIQRLRAQAYASGALRTNAQQTVVVQPGPQPVYVIQPTSPQVVYVPQYNPTVVYAPPTTATVVAPSLITFGLGIGIGALIASSQPWGWGGWGWNWGSRRVYYNHASWGGWARPYRPPTMWYRPRPVVWTNRPGFGGNWRYRPPNYVAPRPAPWAPGRRPWSATNRPGSGFRPPANPRPINRPPANRPLGSGRPANNAPTNRPPANGMGRPSGSQGMNPRATAPNRQAPTRPNAVNPRTTPNRPPSQPVPRSRSGATRPAAPNQSRPAQGRPAPSGKSTPQAPRQRPAPHGSAGKSAPQQRPAPKGKQEQ